MASTNLTAAEAKQMLIQAAESVRQSVDYQLREIGLAIENMKRPEVEVDEILMRAEIILDTFRNTPFNARLDLITRYSIKLAVAEEREKKNV